MRGLGSVCTASPQPQASQLPAAVLHLPLNIPYALHVQVSHTCAAEYTPMHAQLHHRALGGKMRHIIKDALLLPSDAHSLTQSLIIRTHGGTPASPSACSGHCFRTKDCLVFYFPVIVQRLPSLSTLYEPFPKNKYSFPAYRRHGLQQM